MVIMEMETSEPGEKLPTPQGVNYIHPSVTSRPLDLIKGERLSDERFRREIQIIKNELGCNSLRIAGEDTKRALRIAEIAVEEGVVPWMSPRFGGRNFDETKKLFSGYVKACIEHGLQGYPLIVANELVFDCSDAVKLDPGVDKGMSSRHEAIHEILKTGGRPDVTKYVDELVHTARELGWVGPLTYAAFAYETVDWQKIQEPNLYVSANIYWERDLENGQARAPEHYERKIQSLIAQAQGRGVIITEFGATPHEKTLAYGGGSFQLRGEVNYDAQLQAISSYLGVIKKHPDIGYFLYAFDEPKHPAREGSYAIVDRGNNILHDPEYNLTPAAKEFADFNKSRTLDVPTGVEIG